MFIGCFYLGFVFEKFGNLVEEKSKGCRRYKEWGIWGDFGLFNK